MNKKLVRELLSAVLVLASVAVPYAVFHEFISYTSMAEAKFGAEIALMAVSSVLMAAVLYYVAWRIRSYKND